VSYSLVTNLVIESKHQGEEVRLEPDRVTLCSEVSTSSQSLVH